MTFASVRNQINDMLTENGIYKMGSVKTKYKDESNLISTTVHNFMKNYKYLDEHGNRKKSIIGEEINDVYDLSNFLDELDDIINENDYE